MPDTAIQRAVAFLEETGVDHRNRSLSDVLLWDDERWDEMHDFIQWVFPIPGPNEMNPDAPTLVHADFQLLRESAPARAGVQRGWLRMLGFLGLRAERGTVLAAEELDARAETWLLFPTHNDLRISRMLKCLSLCHLQAQAHSTHATLCTLVRASRSYAPEKVIGYWTDAHYVCS